jgi:GNAT superfamily N-acetyltransferase
MNVFLGGLARRVGNNHRRLVIIPAVNPELTRHLSIDGEPLTVRPAAVDELVDLRHRVLRAGLPRDAAVFPGDELPTSLHFGAFDAANNAVGCGTFHRSQWENAPAWQLRGMATDDRFRGRGVGAVVLQLGEEMARRDADSIRQLWCNARIAAVPFYRRAGWSVVSEAFEIPTAGVHFRMTKLPG